MGEELQPTSVWQARNIAEVICEHPARLQIVRCALPALLTRRGSDDGSDATPSRLWSARDGEEDWWLLSWDDLQPGTYWGLVRHTRRDGLQLLHVPEQADDRLLPAVATTAALSATLDLKVDVLRRMQVDWIGPLTRIGDQSVAGQSTSAPAAEQDIGERVIYWHEALLSKLRAKGHTLRRGSGQPVRGFDSWRRQASEPLPADLRKRLQHTIREQIADFRLLDNEALQIVSSRAVPAYPGLKLVEIVDRRQLRARRAEFLFDPDQTLPSIVPLNGESAQLHDLNVRKREHWEAMFASEEGAAAYLDFFVRTVYDTGDDLFFELILDPRQDLRVHPNLQPGGESQRLVGSMERGSEQIGLWRLERHGQSEAGSATSADSATDGPAETRVHLFSALMLYARHLYIVAFKVSLRGGVPAVEMLEDEVCVGGENLHVQPKTLDPDGEFVLTPGTSPLPERNADATAAVADATDAIDAAARRRNDPCCSEPEPPALDLPTVGGTIDGSRFAELFGDSLYGALPRGEHSSTRVAAREPALVVADAVSLRGRRDITGSRLVIGVHFRGRVDLREVSIRGSLTLAHCTFDAPLLLDDVEIDGSLNLRGSQLLGGVSLLNAVVRGSLDLSSAFFVTSKDPRRGVPTRLTGAAIEGDLDLRGAGEPSHASDGGVRLGGCKLHGSLRLGCGAGGHREPMMITQLTGAAARIDGSVLVRGACSIQASDDQELQPLGTVMRLPGAHIGGNVELLAHDRRQPIRLFELERFDAGDLDEGRSSPRLHVLDLDRAHIRGSMLATGCRIEDGILLEGAKVDGRVWLRSVFSAVSRDDGGSEVEVRHWPVVLGQLWLRGLRLGGTLSLEGLELRGDLSLIEADVAGLIHVGPTSSDDQHEDVLALAGAGRRSANVLRTRIDGNVDLAVLQCRSHVRFEGVSVTGWLRLLNTVTGPFNVDPALLLQGPRDELPLRRWEVVPSQVGGISITASEIRGRLRMRLLQVLGRQMPRGQHGLHMDTTVVHDEVSTWQVAFFRDLAEARGLSELAQGFAKELRPWPYAAAVIGDLAMRRCEFRADCGLSLAKVDGEIDLSDTTVRGDLMLASLRSHDEASEGDPDRLADLRRAHAPGNWLQRTMGRRLALAALGCDCDVLLDGVQLLATDSGGPPVLDARHLRVRGDLVWADHGGAAADSALLASGGDLQLEDADLNRFKLADSCPPWRGGGALMLSRSKVRTFQFTWRQHEAEAAGADPAPRRTAASVDLNGIEVAEWALCNRTAHQISGEADDDNAAELFERLATGRPDAPESVWTGMEKYLRAHGLDDKADELYRRMRRHSAKRRKPVTHKDFVGSIVTGFFVTANLLILLWLAMELSRFGVFGWLLAALLPIALLAWRKPRQALHEHVTGYGTRVSPVVCAWALLLLASMPVYMAPQNFELSNSALAARKIEGVIPAGTPAAEFGSLFETRSASGVWSIGHALGTAVRFHVPIIGLVPVEDWEPRDDPTQGQNYELHLCYSLRLETLPRIECTGSYGIQGLSPQAFAAYVQALNWIAWPVFLTFTALKLWRGRAGSG